MADEVPHDGPVMTIAEAAAYLRCTRPHIYALAGRGEINLIHIGRRTVARRADIDRFIENAPRWTPKAQRWIPKSDRK